MSITHYDEFSGIGGTSDGARFVPGVETTDAANHDPEACEEHARNFPDARHYQADVTKLDMTRMPRVDLFTGSPACPGWTDANGVRRDFDRVNAIQDALPGLEGAAPTDPALLKRIKEYKRSRLLMHEIPRYLRAMIERNPANPVLIGMVENVIQCRLWSEWNTWLNEFRKMGYHIRVIALNAMHARPVRAPWAAQSRNRLFVAFWHRSLGRAPDWDKWLRPRAFCQHCCQMVDAIQEWKKPGADMGSYDAQYIYRCPHSRCARRVRPEVVPALTAIDLSRQGIRIGDRARLGMKPLADATLGRVYAGMCRHWAPLPNRTSSVPPLLVPVEARAERDRAASADGPSRTMTTRNETAVAMPFIASLRGGGCRTVTRSVTEVAGTVTAGGNHHALATAPSFLMRNFTARGDAGQMSTSLGEPARTVTANGKQSLITWADALLVPYYGAAESAEPAARPCGTLTTRDRYGVATADGPLVELPALDDVLFRMLYDDEVGRLMGFGPHFRNQARSKRSRMRLYGNAVVPACAELIVSALVECMTGKSLDRELALA